MRITAGKFKNKLVLSYKDKKGELRPTSSRVRMAVFNLLQHGKFLREVDFLTVGNPSLIHGRTIADIYCGTGIMGFEAASRGAEKLIFVDLNGRTLDITKENAEHMGISSDCKFIKANGIQLPAAPAKVDVVFMDPPYGMNLVPPTMKSLLENGWLKDGAVIIAEHSIRDNTEPPEGFVLLDRREYNNTVLSIFKLT